MRRPVALLTSLLLVAAHAPPVEAVERPKKRRHHLAPVELDTALTGLSVGPRAAPAPLPPAPGDAMPVKPSNAAKASRRQRRTAAPPRRSSPPPGRAVSPQGDVLACLRNRESGNRYHITHASGKHFGAYGFDQRTWEGQGGTGSPAAATPAEQDARAASLFAQRGRQPWGGAC